MKDGAVAEADAGDEHVACAQSIPCVWHLTSIGGGTCEPTLMLERSRNTRILDKAEISLRCPHAGGDE